MRPLPLALPFPLPLGLALAFALALVLFLKKPWFRGYQPSRAASRANPWFPPEAVLIGDFDRVFRLKGGGSTLSYLQITFSSICDEFSSVWGEFHQF